MFLSFTTPFMFAESKLEDFLKYHPKDENKNDAFLNILRKKYINNYFPDLGLGIYLDINLQIIEQKDEILEGKVVSQTSDGIFVSIYFFEKIFISKEDLPEISQMTYIYDEDKKNKILVWIWIYKDVKYVIKNEEIVKFKVIKYDQSNKLIKASFNNPGLGPVSWWK
ncbi:rna polymerase n-terminal domain containing protein [Vairimorpha apis BRL 01]|uniref:Rna polymerase n-terminal domain containing protein n=1 Tax=Vairimorpha apis BRL 01 TaxID=1037528 RepID=T0MCH1_9MICR|nr:rna polymerase n-terminal domain containing protein [Vairimorpha apis BRL 01]